MAVLLRVNEDKSELAEGAPIRRPVAGACPPCVVDRVIDDGEIERALRRLDLS